jgi:hypothetical protein
VDHVGAFSGKMDPYYHCLGWPMYLFCLFDSADWQMTSSAQFLKNQEWGGCDNI